MSGDARDEPQPALWNVAFMARPGPDAEVDQGPVGGAFVSVHVVAADAEEAERVAREGIEHSGWWVESGQPPERLDPHALEGEAVELAEQARAEGAVWVFDTWPIDAADDPGPVPG